MQISPLHLALLEEQQIQKAMDQIDDEWVLAQDATAESNRLAIVLYKHLTAAVKAADELNRLKSFEESFARQVTGKLNSVWTMARSLVIITGGFPEKKK